MVSKHHLDDGSSNTCLDNSDVQFGIKEGSFERSNMPPKRFPKKELPVKKPPPMGRKEPENPVAGSSSDEINHEAFDAYEEELAWCIHRLKLSMNAKNLTPRQVEDIRKNVHILENPCESVVKKRCVMRTSLGNYRELMESEKKKVPLELKNAGLKQGVQTSGQFKRKSHTAKEGDESNFSFQPSNNTFRFNFVLNQEE